MPRLHLHLLILAALLCPAGCASVSSESDAASRHTSSDEKGYVVQTLYRHYENWKGVRYQEGGLGRDGIDCSGFVHLTFRNQFDLDLTRTTEALLGVGRKVTRNHLEPLDLVFFKTGLKKRHVGIYVNEGLFLHASTSQGVILSDLSNEYWHDKFWTARRLNL